MTNQKKDSFLEAPRLFLRLLRDEDANSDYPQWLNDGTVSRQNNHHRMPYSRERALEYIRFSRSTKDSIILAICLQDTGKHIGNIALQNIDWIYHHGEFSILLGDREAWGHGYSKEASGLLFDHAFFTLNMHRIACGAYEDNIPMIRLAHYLGMQQEGIEREVGFKNNKYVNSVRMSVLKSDYQRKFPDHV